MKTEAEKLRIATRYLKDKGYEVKKPKKAVMARPDPNGFMRQKEILTVFPVSSATFWRRVKDGEFPKPVKLSERVTVWRRGEVEAYLEGLAAMVYVPKTVQTTANPKEMK